MRSIKGGFIVKLILIVCFSFLIFLFVVRRNMRTDVSDFFNACKINFGNMEREFFPQRRRPFSLVRQETELKLLLPDPFVDLSAEEWQGFWELVYGNIGTEITENPRMPIIRRQFTLPELEEQLLSRYPVFKRFQPQHWQEFWSIVLRKKRFKRR